MACGEDKAHIFGHVKKVMMMHHFRCMAENVGFTLSTKYSAAFYKVNGDIAYPLRYSPILSAFYKGQGDIVYPLRYSLLFFISGR